MIRPAILPDIPRIADLMAAAHQSSPLALLGNIDGAVLVHAWTRIIELHGGDANGSTFGMVSEERGKVEGFFAGMVNRVYSVGDKLQATDVFLHVSEDGDHHDWSRLLDAYIAWARKVPRLVRIRLSASDLFGDAERVAQLYERKGFEKCGVIYQRSVRHE